MTTKPFQFQKKDAHRIERFGGVALLSSEPGMGKTFTSLLWAKWFLDRGPIIVVCPATIKINWQREARKHLGMRAEILNGRRPPTHGLHDHPGKMYVINYDILGSPQDPHSWVNVLRKTNPGLVIPDEVHACKSRDSQRTKATRYLCESANHVIAISGTPLTNRPAELWPVLNMLRPDIFSSFWSFGSRYCDPKRTPWGWDMRGASNLDELHQVLKGTVMVRRRKADVLDQLPTKLRSVVPLEIDNKKEYHQAVHNFLTWLRKYGKSKAKKAERAEKLVQMGYLKRLAAKFKMKSALQWVEDHLEDGGGKLLLFAVHREIVDLIHKKFGKISVVVDGSVTGRKRQAAIDAFNTDPKCRLLIGNIQAAGVGWSCKSTSDVAFVELPWVPGELTQAEDRIHGIARGTGAANYHYLVAENTIEEKLVWVLTHKQNILDQTMDGTAGISRFDILDVLEEALMRGVKK